MKYFSLIIVSLSLSLTGCKKDEKEKAPTEPTTEVATTETATPTPAEEVALPTSLDFEDEAESSISADNYEEALADLEAEINTEQ